MLEPDESSVIPRARLQSGRSDRWRDLSGVPAVRSSAEVDLPSGQRRAFQRLIEILDEPMIGQIHHDFLLRRAQVEAARVMLSLKPTPLPTTFPMPRLESVADAVAAHAAIIETVSSGKLAPLEGCGDIARDRGMGARLEGVQAAAVQQEGTSK